MFTTSHWGDTIRSYFEKCPNSEARLDVLSFRQRFYRRRSLKSKKKKHWDNNRFDFVQFRFSLLQSQNGRLSNPNICYRLVRVLWGIGYGIAENFRQEFNFVAFVKAIFLTKLNSWLNFPQNDKCGIRNSHECKVEPVHVTTARKSWYFSVTSRHCFISIKLDIISKMVRFCFDNNQHSMRFPGLD